MKHFILGTDWWTDCDDAVAVRVLTRAHKRGEIVLDGIGINACMEKSVASLKMFLKQENVGDIPVGIDRTATDYEGTPRYQYRLAAMLPDVTNDDAPDAAELYLSILRAATEPVEIVEIGFAQVIESVIRRDPALFAAKVAHVWMMAGKWDEDGGREHNFCLTERSRTAAHNFCELCPVPVTFLGFEVSHSVISGSRLSHSDPLWELMADHGSPNGRMSWDPMTAELALIGNAAKAGYREVKGVASVDASDGANHFREDPAGRHSYVAKVFPDEIYRDRIDKLIKTE